MDAMVSARVPVEVKRQGDSKLKEIGSSVTELVNSAYDYLLENGSLPTTKAAVGSGSVQEKVLSGEEALAFKKRWGSRCVLDSPDYDGSNFKELLDQARGDRYAGLA